MISLFLRNLFFTILQPGLVVGLIPFWILDLRFKTLFPPVWQLHHYVAAFVFLMGFIIMIWCIVNFAIKGRGTLSPADPTKKLVVHGLYTFSRNPMYVGVILILIGEVIFFRSLVLCGYTLFVFITFTVFIVLVEEPRLRRDFGEEYDLYCQEVRRWL